MALGHARATRLADERQVPPAGRRCAERAVDDGLERRRGQEVVAAHHVGDALCNVVHRDRQLVRREPRLGPHDAVALVRAGVEGVLARHAVVDVDGAGVDAQAMVDVAAREAPRGPRRRAQRCGEARGGVVGVRRTEGGGGLAYLRARVRALVDQPGGGQALHGVCKGIEAFALADHLAVMVDAEPTERFLRAGVAGGARSVLVQVLDAQHQPPAEIACQRPVHQERAGVPEVERPGGGGCNA